MTPLQPSAPRAGWGDGCVALACPGHGPTGRGCPALRVSRAPRLRHPRSIRGSPQPRVPAQRPSPRLGGSRCSRADIPPALTLLPPRLALALAVPDRGAASACEPVLALPEPAVPLARACSRTSSLSRLRRRPPTPLGLVACPSCSPSCPASVVVHPLAVVFRRLDRCRGPARCRHAERAVARGRRRRLLAVPCCWSSASLSRRMRAVSRRSSLAPCSSPCWCAWRRLGGARRRAADRLGRSRAATSAMVDGLLVLRRGAATATARPLLVDTGPRLAPTDPRPPHPALVGPPHRPDGRFYALGRRPRRGEPLRSSPTRGPLWPFRFGPTDPVRAADASPAGTIVDAGAHVASSTAAEETVGQPLSYFDVLRPQRSRCQRRSARREPASITFVGDGFHFFRVPLHGRPRRGRADRPRPRLRPSAPAVERVAHSALGGSVDQSRGPSTPLCVQRWR